MNEVQTLSEAIGSLQKAVDDLKNEIGKTLAMKTIRWMSRNLWCVIGVAIISWLAFFAAILELI